MQSHLRPLYISFNKMSLQTFGLISRSMKIASWEKSSMALEFIRFSIVAKPHYLQAIYLCQSGFLSLGICLGNVDFDGLLIGYLSGRTAAFICSAQASEQGRE